MSFGRILNVIAGKFNTETYYDDVKLIIFIWKNKTVLKCFLKYYQNTTLFLTSSDFKV
jgi:hypothetical protein